MLAVLLKGSTSLPDCRFVICGDGVSRQELQSKAEALGLKNMVFLPLQPLEQLSAMLSAADIHLVIQKGGAADLVMPSKLTNILAVGGVAIATAEPESELGRLGKGDTPCLYRCDPEDADALVKAIRALKGDRQMSEKISYHAKAYADKHIAMDQVLGQFEKKLKEM